MLDEIRHYDFARTVVAAFNGADGRPVVIDSDGKALLIAAIEKIGHDGGEMNHRPDDLTELGYTFAAELDRIQTRRIDPVTVQLRRDVVVISWEERTDLLARMAADPSAWHVIEKFRALGTTRSIVPSRDEARELHARLLDWVGEVGYDRLPEGLRALLAALAEEVGFSGPGIAFATSADP